MIDAESTAQIARINEMWRARVMEALQDKELRKWCIEKALSVDNQLTCGPPVPTRDIAAELHKFITAPLSDLLQEK